MLKKFAVLSAIAVLAMAAFSVSDAQTSDNPTTTPATAAASKPVKKAKKAATSQTNKKSDSATDVKSVAPEQEAIKLVPADCLAFVTVNSVDNFAGQLDDLAAKLIPAQFRRYMLKDPVLDMLKYEISLGDDFREGGTFIALAMDPRKYSPELLKSTSAPTSEPADAQDDDDKDISDVIPGVLIIPANGVENLLDGTTMEKKDDYYSFDETGWAMQIGKYVVLSTNPKCREAFKSIKQLDMPKEVTDTLATNDVSGWVDIKAITEIAKSINANASLDLTDTLNGPAAFMNSLNNAMSAPNMFIANAEYIVGGVRFLEKGPVVTARAHYPADCAAMKILAACQATDKSLLSLIPKTNTVMAVGIADGFVSTPEAIKEEMKGLYTDEPFNKLPKEFREKIDSHVAKWVQQIRSYQMYLGGATGETLPMGMILVVKCKSSEEAIGLLKETPDIVGELINKMIAEETKNLSNGQDADEKTPKIAFKYNAGVDTIGGVKVDSIEVDISALEEMSPETQGNLEAIIGDDKLRIMAATINADTVVITFGGGTATMAEAIKSASKPAEGIDTDPANSTSIEMLPKQRISVGVLDMGAYVMSIMDAVRILQPSMPVIPPLDSQPPAVFSVSVDKSDAVFTGFLPTDSLKAVIDQVVQGLYAGQGGDF